MSLMLQIGHLAEGRDCQGTLDVQTPKAGAAISCGWLRIQGPSKDQKPKGKIPQAGRLHLDTADLSQSQDSQGVQLGTSLLIQQITGSELHRP